jgi:hypothetical protein
MLAADAQRCEHVFGVCWYHHAGGNLTVDRGVIGVQSAGAVVESDFTGYCACQLHRQPTAV